jgi:hypothetical protein
VAQGPDEGPPGVPGLARPAARGQGDHPVAGHGVRLRPRLRPVAVLLWQASGLEPLEQVSRTKEDGALKVLFSYSVLGHNSVNSIHFRLV